MLPLAGVEDKVCIAQGVFHVVGHHDDGDALGLVEVGQCAVEILGGGGIQARHRLIQDQQLSGCAQGPGQEYPLLLAAG